jgi:hypothetical protein
MIHKRLEQQLEQQLEQRGQPHCEQNNQHHKSLIDCSVKLYLSPSRAKRANILRAIAEERRTKRTPEAMVEFHLTVEIV